MPSFLRSPAARPGLAALGLALLAPAPARAHGLWGHIHVTGWAVENMPDDELRAFLLEPEVFNALLFGATFTDTGYAVDDPASRAYSEHTHWEPFIEDYVEWLRANDPPPWDDLESRKRVAFLMGCASHGLQDELFDSLFLYQVEEHDGGGQDEADPGTDGFLALDGHLRLFPTEYIPLETVLELYTTLDEEVTEAVIDEAVGLVTGVYINDTLGPAVAEQLGEQYQDVIPWTREHYLDADLPGSLRAEVYPTMAYQQAIWDRLHDGLDADEATVFAYPEPPRRVGSTDAASAHSWVSVVFGVGVRYTDDLAVLVDAEGAVVPTVSGNSRWDPEWTRVFRLLPAEDLAPGGWYTVRLRAGVETIDGQTSTAPWEMRFQAPCDEATAALCEDLGEIPEAGLDGELSEDPDPAEPPDTPAEAGCGCATGPSGAWVGGTLLAAALVRRRRATTGRTPARPRGPGSPGSFPAPRGDSASR